MAKRAKRTRRAKQTPESGTNWWIIGGIAGVGAIALFVLLFMTLQAQDAPPPTSTPFLGQAPAEYCEENPDRCMTNGSEDAPITIVEISDYGCGHCANFNRDTSGLLEDLYVTPGQVKWVVLPYALGPQTVPASAAAMCAAEQESFFPYHSRLFEEQGEPDFMTKTSFSRVAENVGLDVNAFEECVDEGRYSNTVQLNSIAAAEAGVGSTPTFFINDEMFAGNRPLTFFQEEINAILGGS